MIQLWFDNNTCSFFFIIYLSYIDNESLETSLPYTFGEEWVES